jgi:hypothetical protein
MLILLYIFFKKINLKKGLNKKHHIHVPGDHEHRLLQHFYGFIFLNYLDNIIIFIIIVVIVVVVK